MRPLHLVISWFQYIAGHFLVSESMWALFTSQYRPAFRRVNLDNIGILYVKSWWRHLIRMEEISQSDYGRGTRCYPHWRRDAGHGQGVSTSGYPNYVWKFLPFEKHKQPWLEDVGQEWQNAYETAIWYQFHRKKSPKGTVLMQRTWILHRIGNRIKRTPLFRRSDNMIPSRRYLYLGNLSPHDTAMSIHIPGGPAEATIWCISINNKNHKKECREETRFTRRLAT